jgi:hypothetical protein
MRAINLIRAVTRNAVIQFWSVTLILACRAQRKELPFRRFQLAQAERQARVLPASLYSRLPSRTGSRSEDGAI